MTSHAPLSVILARVLQLSLFMYSKLQVPYNQSPLQSASNRPQLLPLTFRATASRNICRRPLVVAVEFASALTCSFITHSNFQQTPRVPSDLAALDSLPARFGHAHSNITVWILASPGHRCFAPPCTTLGNILGLIQTEQMPTTTAPWPFRILRPSRINCPCTTTK